MRRSPTMAIEIVLYANVKVVESIVTHDKMLEMTVVGLPGLMLETVLWTVVKGSSYRTAPALTRPLNVVGIRVMGSLTDTYHVQKIHVLVSTMGLRLLLRLKSQISKTQNVKSVSVVLIQV